jgi:hypothetical protein
MKIWQELESVNIEDKEKYLEAFKGLLNKREIKESEDYIVVEERIKGEKMISIVPRELINLFRKMRAQAPNEFLGFSVLVEGIRFSCFGIQCNELSKAVIGR